MNADLSFVLLAGALGAVPGFLVWRTISQRKRMESHPLLLEKTLKELAPTSRLEEYDALLAYCGNGVVILDHDENILSSNIAARYLFGIPVERMIGKSIREVSGSQALSDLVKRTKSSRTMQREEIVTTGINSSSLVVTVAPIEDEGKHTNRLLIVTHNITELRRLETVRRDFVANVSHELRNPLASIRGMAETLQDGALDDHSVSEHFLQTIITEAQRLTRIADDLLSLTHAESRSPEKEFFLLSRLINHLKDRFETQARKSEIMLKVEVGESLEVFANYDQMEQVLINLLDNAIKYTPEGGEIRLTAERVASLVLCHVSDTGIGIQKKDLPRIFERFYRVDKARSRQSGGTGLGLAIVKHIVEAHNGTVGVESEYQKGTTFTFTLPYPHSSSESDLAVSRLAEKS